MGCDDDTKCERVCDDAVHDGGSQPSGTLLGADAASYTESNEATNSSATSPEATSYTLETANGIAIHGSFEASNPTADRYRFNSGTLGEAGAPGFPGVDILLVIDGSHATQHPAAVVTRYRTCSSCAGAPSEVTARSAVCLVQVAARKQDELAA